MKRKRFFYFFGLTTTVCVAILFAIWQEDRLICIFSPKTPEERWAEQTILAYIDTTHRDITYCSVRYNYFLKGILLGEVPELINPPSTFIKNGAESQIILEYAAQNFRLPREMRSSLGTEVPVLEAAPREGTE
jgi:hypothetical protein